MVALVSFIRYILLYLYHRFFTIDTYLKKSKNLNLKKRKISQKQNFNTELVHFKDAKY